MQQRLPAPLGSEQRPDVVVLSPGTRPAAPASPVLRLALQMAPDVLRALERSRSQKQTLAPAMPAPRTTVHGMSMSEVELDIRLPLVRRAVSFTHLNLPTHDLEFTSGVAGPLTKQP